MNDRDRKRQQAWIKAEARRQVAQERADALTELGVPCAQRSGWVVLLDPEGLMARLAHCGCIWCCARNAPGVIPGEAHARCCGRSPVPDFRPDDYPKPQWPDEGSRG